MSEESSKMNSIEKYSDQCNKKKFSLFENLLNYTTSLAILHFKKNEVVIVSAHNISNAIPVCLHYLGLLDKIYKCSEINSEKLFFDACLRLCRGWKLQQIQEKVFWSGRKFQGLHTGSGTGLCKLWTGARHYGKREKSTEDFGVVLHVWQQL